MKHASFVVTLLLSLGQAAFAADVRTPEQVRMDEARFKAVGQEIKKAILADPRWTEVEKEGIRSVSFEYVFSSRPRVASVHAFGAVQVSLSDGWMTSAESLSLLMAATEHASAATPGVDLGPGMGTAPDCLYSYAGYLTKAVEGHVDYGKRRYVTIKGATQYVDEQVDPSCEGLQQRLRSEVIRTRADVYMAASLDWIVANKLADLLRAINAKTLEAESLKTLSPSALAGFSRLRSPGSHAGGAASNIDPAVVVDGLYRAFSWWLSSAEDRSRQVAVTPRTRQEPSLAATPTRPRPPADPAGICTSAGCA